MKNTLPFLFFGIAVNVFGEAGIVDLLRSQQLDKGRVVVKEFQKRLGHELKSAMTSGGPVNAISVCKDQAQPIAEATSKKHNLVVRRVSLKPRNPADSPDIIDRQVLNDFAENFSTKEMKPLEKQVNLDNGKARYYKSIAIKPLCLACHGETIHDEVKKKLNSLYPNDLATGYKPGDLRGAFVVEFNEQ